MIRESKITIDSNRSFIHLVYRILIRPIAGEIKMELINISNVGGKNIRASRELNRAGNWYNDIVIDMIVQYQCVEPIKAG